MIRRPPRSPLFPYTPLSRSRFGREAGGVAVVAQEAAAVADARSFHGPAPSLASGGVHPPRPAPPKTAGINPAARPRSSSAAGGAAATPPRPCGPPGAPPPSGPPPGGPPPETSPPPPPRPPARPPAAAA